MQLVNCVARNIQFTYNSQLFANSLPLLAFYKFLYLCKLSTISEGELADFVHWLKTINPFFDYKTQRDAHEALILLLDIFSNICNLPLKENKISTVPEFVDSFFSGIYKIFFIRQENTSYQEMPNILLIQINRFSVSNLHGKPQKNNHPFGIYENIK